MVEDDDRQKPDYEIGYRKPPKEHRFKPGNKANPRGRTKGSKSKTLTIRQVLFEPIQVREGEQVKRMSALEAVIRKVRNKALSGDSKASLTIIGLAQKEGLLTPEQNEVIEESLSDVDKAILADFQKRVRNSQE